MKKGNIKYEVDLQFFAIKLPPVKDILVLGKKYPQGKTGVMECFRFIAPDEFEMVEIPDPELVVDAVMINKRILSRMSKEDIIAVLKENVFPFISEGEAINVNFDVRIGITGIEMSPKQ